MLLTRTRKTETLPFQPPFFYGWIIVVVGALSVFFSGPGQTYSVSVFLDSYIAEYGWSRSFVSSMYSIGTLGAGFALLIVGRQVDRRGHRFMMPVIAGLLALALVWMSVVISPWMLVFGFFLIRLLGQGSMTLLGSTLVPQWFERKRARAMSLMSVGGVLGAALLPPFNTWMIQNFGWRFGWRFWAVALVVVMVPAAIYLVRNRPESVGSVPDGVPKAGDHSADTYIAARSWTLNQAKRTRSFWLFLFCMFVPSMVNTGITFHIVSILGEKGISPTQSAFVLGLMAMVALPTTFFAGWVLDRFPVHKVVAIASFLQVLTMIWLLYIQAYGMAVAFGVVRGFIQGFESMNVNVFWPNYFGRKHLGSIRGFAMIFMVVGSAFGPLPFGVAFDLFGSYSQILWFMMLFPAASIWAASQAVPPKWEDYRR